MFTSYSTPLVLPRIGLLGGRKSTVKMAHAMRNAREGHSVTYLQSKEVPAGIHVRRQGARLGATGTSKSLSLRCEVRSCRRCSEVDSPRSPRISTGEGDLDTARPCIRLCAVGKMFFLARTFSPAPHRMEGNQALRMPVSDLLESRCGLRARRTKTGPLSGRRAVLGC